MPEYLAPGVYVEETSFRAKSIEGTSTSTTAFVGLTTTGPGGDSPELLTSFGDFQRIYGGLDDLVDGGGSSRVNYLAHGVRSYFDNGGSRLYVTRVVPASAAAAVSDYVVGSGGNAATAARFEARFAGSGGNGTIAVRARHVAATRLLLRRAPLGSLLRRASGPDGPASIPGNATGPFALVPDGKLHVSVSGSPVTATFRAQATEVTGTVLAGPVPLDQPGNAGKRTLSVTLGSGAPQVIELGDQALTPVQVANRINEQLRGGYAVLQDDSRLRIGNDVRGLGGGVTVSDNDLIGFAGGSSSQPDPGLNDVQNIDAVTVAEIAALLGPSATATTDSGTGVLVLESTATGESVTLAVIDGPDAIHQRLGLSESVSPVPGVQGSATPRYYIKSANGEGADIGTWTRDDDVDLLAAQGPSDVPNETWHLVTLALEASDRAGRSVLQSELGFDSRHPQYLGSVFPRTPARRADALENGFCLVVGASVTGFQLYQGLVGGLAAGELRRFVLAGGHDGNAPSTSEYQPAFDEVEKLDDVSIVAAPGYTSFWDAAAPATQALVQGIQEMLIAHAEARRSYRIAVLETPAGFTPTEARDWRSRVDSTHAALYYPWVYMANPLARPGDSSQPHELALPPSGFVCGIYARNDVSRGVHKAPANEVVRGGLRFERPVSFGQQEMLNPIGVNCLRSFPGRGNRVWGARTASSDAEFKYVSDRRYFNYLGRSIDGSTQFAVFEPNGDKLWRNVRDMVSEFLYNEWRNGALLGKAPEEAYFVRCDRSTMTQNDLDNGRLICLVGVALLKPAEFVIFRIGQKTADARA